MGTNSSKDGDVPLPTNAHPEAKYTQVSCNMSAGYLLRSDGIVARSASSGIITQYIIPPEGMQYTSVNAGEGASYLVRSDGAVDVTKSQGKIKKTYQPPPNVKYVGVSVGSGASYMVRDDGVVDRVTGIFSESVTKSMNPPPMQRYLSVSCGVSASYLVRSDGKVDRTVSRGDIESTMESTSPYIAVGEQMSWTQSDGKVTIVHQNPANYLLRQDGVMDRTVRNGQVEREMQASCTSGYVSASAGEMNSYLVRADGAADVIRGGEVIRTENPPPGTKFISVSVGYSVVYVLVNNGTVLRFAGRNDIKTMVPGGNTDLETS